MFYILFVFFFFKQKTAYEMRISDWSSDVCSSDLPEIRRCRADARGNRHDRRSKAGRGPCRTAAGWQVRAQWPCFNSGNVPRAGAKRIKRLIDPRRDRKSVV